jgi:hypothetical protein
VRGQKRTISLLNLKKHLRNNEIKKLIFKEKLVVGLSTWFNREKMYILMQEPQK